MSATGPVTELGALGSVHRAWIDPRGLVGLTGARWVVDWWIGADDRWHVPAVETAVRQRLAADGPVPETVMRVPGGDAVQRAYAVGGAGGLVAIEGENRSPVPFVVAFVLRPALRGDRRGRLARIALDGTVVMTDGRPALVVPRPPSRWVVATTGGEPALEIVRSGRAVAGPFVAARDRGGALEIALLYPLSHRSTLRVGLLPGVGETGEAGRVDLTRVPSAADATRGWAAQLGRGMRVELPDEGVQRGVDAARAALLLAAESSSRPTAAVVAVLEEWGFAPEAAAARERLRWRARRALAHVTTVRPHATGGRWEALRARLDAASPTWAWADGPAPTLRLVRSLLVGDDDAGAVALVPELPPAWLGRDLAVHNAPTRSGRVSYALRWHGPRPTVLWEVSGAPAGVRVRAPGLDAVWASDRATGEVLLEPVVAAPGAS